MLPHEKNKTSQNDSKKTHKKIYNENKKTETPQKPLKKPN